MYPKIKRPRVLLAPKEKKERVSSYQENYWIVLCAFGFME